MALAAFVLAATVSGAGAARAGAIPDSAHMEELRAAVGRAPVVLARGDFGLREYHQPWLDSAGVHARLETGPPPRRALFGDARATPASDHAIAWSRISTLQTQHPRKGRGAMIGFFAGFVVGMTVLSRTEDSFTGSLEGLGWVLGAPVSGVLIGGILGSISGKKVIYRAQTQEIH